MALLTTIRSTLNVPQLEQEIISWAKEGTGQAVISIQQIVQFSDELFMENGKKEALCKGVSQKNTSETAGYGIKRCI